MSPNRFRRGLLLFMLSFLAVPFMAVAAQAADVTVFAAASLKNALDDAAKLFQTKTGDKVNVSYAASSALAKQIESGAPADIFFSADLDWMDYLQEKKLIDVASRHTLLGNTLVWSPRRIPRSRSPSKRISRCFRRSAPTGSSPWGRSTACPPANTARQR